jgi:uncharacterized membrane protein YgcG
MRPSLFILIVLTLLPGIVKSGYRYFERPAGSHCIFDKGLILSHTDEIELKERFTNFRDTSGIEFLLITIPEAPGESMSDYASGLALQWEHTGEITARSVLMVIEARHNRLGIGAGSALQIEFPVSVAHNIRRRLLKPSFSQQEINLDNIIIASDVLMAIATGREEEAGFKNSLSLGIFSLIVLLVIFFGLLYPLILLKNFRRTTIASRNLSYQTVLTWPRSLINSNITGFDDFSTGRGPFSGRTRREVIEGIKNGGGGARGKW